MAIVLEPELVDQRVVGVVRYPFDADVLRDAAIQAAQARGRFDLFVQGALSNFRYAHPKIFGLHGVRLGEIIAFPRDFVRDALFHCYNHREGFDGFPLDVYHVVDMAHRLLKGFWDLDVALDLAQCATVDPEDGELIKFIQQLKLFGDLLAPKAHAILFDDVEVDLDEALFPGFTVKVDMDEGAHCDLEFWLEAIDDDPSEWTYQLEFCHNCTCSSSFRTPCTCLYDNCKVCANWSDLVERIDVLMDTLFPRDTARQHNRKVWNALMHMTYGNSTMFSFDPHNSRTWKFDEVDADRYVLARVQNRVVVKVGYAKAVELLLRRRGARIDLAWINLRDHFDATNTGYAKEFIYVPRQPERAAVVTNDMSYLDCVIDKISLGEKLTRGEKRLVKKIPGLNRVLYDSVEKHTAVMQIVESVVTRSHFQRLMDWMAIQYNELAFHQFTGVMSCYFFHPKVEVCGVEKHADVHELMPGLKKVGNFSSSSDATVEAPYTTPRSDASGEASVMKPSVWTRVKNMVPSLPTLKVEHGLSAKAHAVAESVAGAADRVTEVLGGVRESVPQRVTNAAAKAKAKVSDLGDAVLDVVMKAFSIQNDSVRVVLRVVRDMIVLHNVQGIIANSGVFFYLQQLYGIKYAGCLLGASMVMKQITKWLLDDDAIDKHAGFLEIGGEDMKHFVGTWLNAFTTHSREVAAVNSVVTLARTSGSVAQVLGKFILDGLNVFWLSVFKTELYLTPAAKARKMYDVLYHDVQIAMAMPVRTDEIERSMRTSLRMMRQQLAIFGMSLPSDEIRNMQLTLQAITQSVGDFGVETQYDDPKAKATVIMLEGDTQIGKTTVARLLTTAIGKELGWKGRANQWLSVMQLDNEEFGLRLPEFCQAIQIDEPFNQSDSSITGIEVRNFQLLIGPQVVQFSGAAVEAKDQVVRPKLVILTLNAVAPELGVVNGSAATARIDFHLKVRGNIRDLYERDDCTIADLDKALQFEANGSFSFSEVVKVAVERIRHYDAGKHRMQQFENRILADFHAPAHSPDIKKFVSESLTQKQGTVDGHWVSAVQKKAGLAARDRVREVWASEIEKHVKLSVDFKERIPDALLPEIEALLDEDENPYTIGLDTEEHENNFRNFCRVNKVAKAGEQYDLGDFLHAFDLDEGPWNVQVVTSDDACCVYEIEDVECKRCLCHDRPLACKLRLRHWRLEAVEEQQVAVPVVPQVEGWTVMQRLQGAGQYLGSKLHKVLDKVIMVGKDAMPWAVWILKYSAYCLAAALIGYATGTLLNYALSVMEPSWAVAKHAYANVSAVQAKKEIRARPAIVSGVVPHVKVSLLANPGPPEQRRALIKKVVWPCFWIAEVGNGRVFSASNQLVLLDGRVCASVRHVLDVQGRRPNKLFIPPPYNKVFDVCPFDGLEKKRDGVVQVVLMTEMDGMFVVLPIGCQFGASGKKATAYRRDVNVSLSDDLTIYYRSFPEVEYDPDSPTPFVAVGDMEVLESKGGSLCDLDYMNYRDGERCVAYIASGANPTRPGMCTGPVIPMNPRYGGGNRVLGLYMTGSSASGMLTMFGIFREDIDDLNAAFPWINSGVTYEDLSGVEFADVQSAIVDKKASICELEKPGYLPSDSGLRKSLVFGVLEGVTDGNHVIPAPFRVPSKMVDVEDAFRKYPPFLPVCPQSALDEFRVGARRYAEYYLSACAPFTKVRSEPLSNDEAINGTLDGTVEAMNLDASWGFSLDSGVPNGPKRTFMECGSDGRWNWKPEYAEEAQMFFDGLVLSFVFYWTLMKSTPKGELRPPGKRSRLTSCELIFICVALRRVWAPVHSMTAAFAPLNGMGIGVDPTGPNGDVMWRRLMRFTRWLCGDAKFFDARKDAQHSFILAEEFMAPVLQRVYPDWSRQKCIAVAIISTAYSVLGYEVLGWDVYLHIDSFFSGDLNTGFGNSGFSGSLAMVAFSRARNMENGVMGSFQEDLDTKYFCVTVGDDVAIGTSLSTLTNFVMRDVYRENNMMYTSSSKEDVESDFDDELEFLKRTPALFMGRWVGLHPLEGCSEIASYVRTTINSKKDASVINADQALDSLFFYGEPLFEAARQILVEKLFARGCAKTVRTYSDFLVNWQGKFGDRVSEQVVKHCSVTELKSRTVILPRRVATTMMVLLVCTACGVLASSVAENGFALGSTHYVMKRSANNIDGIPESNSATAPGVKVTVAQDLTSGRGDGPPPEKQLSQLTQFADATAKIEEVIPSMSEQLRNSLNPFADQGLDAVLSRPYKVTDFTWNSTDATGVVCYQAILPELLFSIPNIASKLTAFRYLNTACKISFRVNGTQYLSGRLLVASLPFQTPTTSWRNNFGTIIQGPHVLMSANSTESVEITMPWLNPMNFRDLTAGPEGAYIGMIYVAVMHPLSTVSTSSATSIKVSVFAEFVRPIVAGMDLVGTPALGGFEKHSNISEMVGKIQKGVLEGVSSASSTVSGLLSAAGPLLDMATKVAPMVLDKPPNLAVTQFFTKRNASDFALVSGVQMASPVAAHANAQVSVDRGIQGEENPQPGFVEMCGRPGLCKLFSFDTTYTVGTELMTLPVRPNVSLPLLVGATTYQSLPPVCYFSQFFRFWRGGMKYLFVFSASSFTSARVRISYMPSNAVSTDPPENQAGDVPSAIVSINGDTLYELEIPYLSQTLYKEVGVPTSASSDISAMGRITMTLVNAVLSAPGATATIWCSVYQSAGTGFQLMMPDGWSVAITPVWSFIAVDSDTGAPGVFGNTYARGYTKIEDVVEKHSDIRAIFAKPFKPIIPATAVMEKGICSPEFVDGILELGKRFEVLGNDMLSTLSPINQGIAQLNYSTWHWRLVAPFLTWRGGSVWKMMPVTTLGAVISPHEYDVTWLPTFGVSAFDVTMAGVVPFRMTEDVPWAEFYTPFYDSVFSRETQPILADQPALPQWAITSTATGTTLVTLSYAFADDFSVGVFMGTPMAVISGETDLKVEEPLLAPDGRFSEGGYKRFCEMYHGKRSQPDNYLQERAVMSGRFGTEKHDSANVAGYLKTTSSGFTL
jgi:hypothetical protein